VIVQVNLQQEAERMTRSLQRLPHSSHGKEEKSEISAGLWVQADTSERDGIVSV